MIQNEKFRLPWLFIIVPALGSAYFRSPVGPWRYYLIRTGGSGIAGWAVQNRAPCRQGGECPKGADGAGELQGPSRPLAFTRADRTGRRCEAGHGYCRGIVHDRGGPIRVSAASWETQPGRRSVPGGRHPPPRAGGASRDAGRSSFVLMTMGLPFVTASLRRKAGPPLSSPMSEWS